MAGSRWGHMDGDEVVLLVPMFGQLLELPPGVVDECGVLVVLPPLVEVLDVAALAIAAPPPTTAPVTARVVSNGFSRRLHLL